MRNTQLHVFQNGTTTLATAGKYCDRNIDVHVSVADKPQFTNRYDPANVTIDHKVSVSSNVVSKTPNSEVNILRIPFLHLPGEPFALRMRGIGLVRSNLVMVLYGEDGETRVNHFYSSDQAYCALTYDEYGDAVLTLQGSLVDARWYSLEMNFQYTGLSSAEQTLAGPIVTVNEPIGNALEAACPTKHFTMVIEGNGRDTLSFRVPFEPDWLCVTGMWPATLTEENNLVVFVCDLRNFGQVGGFSAYHTTGNTVKMTMYTTKSVLSRYSRQENGQVTLTNIPTEPNSDTMAVFPDQVQYTVTAVRYTDKTDRERITEYVEALTGSGKVTLNSAKVNAAFTDEEWAALIATKPDYTFALF